jgi:hypothetical protein
VVDGDGMLTDEGQWRGWRCGVSNGSWLAEAALLRLAAAASASEEEVASGGGNNREFISAGSASGCWGELCSR